MLLSERDQLRTIYAEKFQIIQRFEYEDMRRILGDLALWMLESDGALLIDYDNAIEHLESKLTFMKSISGYTDEQAHNTAKLLLDYFIERGGILRWIEANKIGFIHKTFQEYFAAYQIYLESSWNLIMSSTRATDDNWRETILLSIAFSSKENAEKVIDHYLYKGGTYNDIAEADKNKFVYRILAINCAAMARELRPQTTSRIEIVTRSIIPPNNQSQVIGLSSCGNLVVPLLGYQKSYTEQNLHDCATVLLKVGTSQSLSQMSGYLDSKSKSSFNVINQYWKYLSHDTIMNSNVIPSYVRAIIEHTVSISKGKAIATEKAILTPV